MKLALSPAAGFRSFSFETRLLSGLLLAALLSAASSHAQAPAQGTTPSPQQTGSNASATQVASNRDNAEAAALAHQLASLSEEAGSSSGAATTNDAGPAGIVPFTPGLNASIGTTNQHDSSDGWQSILTPNLAYRFNRHFSANVTVPVYAYINIYGVLSSKNATKNTPASATYGYKTQKFLLGDTDLVGEFEAHPSVLDYNFTATVGLPSGDDAAGLGAGQVTYSVNNHFEHALNDWIVPDIELGIGDSPNLDDLRARRSYIVVGENAHFQAGLSFAFRRNITFTSDAYEDLPLASQTVTTTTTNGKKGRQLKTVTTTSQKGIGEDNGFLNTLDIPLNGHVTLSGIYNRSLRNKVDTPGFSLTFTLRKTPYAAEFAR